MKFIKIITCPKCNGTKKVYDHAYGIMTLGFGYLEQYYDQSSKIDCPTCGGKGYIELKN